MPGVYMKWIVSEAVTDHDLWWFFGDDWTIGAVLRPNLSTCRLQNNIFYVLNPAKSSDVMDFLGEALRF